MVERGIHRILHREKHMEEKANRAEKQRFKLWHGLDIYSM
jgi:hypothetical protein